MSDIAVGMGEDINQKNHMSNCKIRAVKTSNKCQVYSARKA